MNITASYKMHVQLGYEAYSFRFYTANIDKEEKRFYKSLQWDVTNLISSVTIMFVSSSSSSSSPFPCSYSSSLHSFPFFPYSFLKLLHLVSSYFLSSFPSSVSLLLLIPPLLPFFWPPHRAPFSSFCLTALFLFLVPQISMRFI